VQYRYIWEDGRVTPFRRPSDNTNGNSFDYQGRQLSCQDFFRRVVRWEHDGAMTVIADSYDGKPLNSPNDIVPHPDGSIWFTDPPYGGRLNEGKKVANQRLFSDMMHDGVKCGPDGMRADVYGNLWISSNAPLGYAGVLCFTPQGKLIGRIRLPEVCANLAFGGPKRDRLFMCASQSLYVLQVNTQGAAPG
jgi:sugar lactone lactonase YvrE